MNHNCQRYLKSLRAELLCCLIFTGLSYHNLSTRRDDICLKRLSEILSSRRVSALSAGGQITGSFCVALGIRPDFTSTCRKDLVENKVISRLNPRSAASTLFLLRPALDRRVTGSSAFSRGPEANLPPDRMTLARSKNGRKRGIMGGWRIRVCLWSSPFG